MKDKNARFTVPIPAEHGEELEAIAERTGLPVAVLFRQGALRIIREFRETGAVSSVALEQPEPQPA